MAKTSLIPGFRFHPTDTELVVYYLKRKLLGKKIIGNAVAEVNIYDFSPWDLPDKSSLKSGDLEWYFFCPKAKKYSMGQRSNRATETGFWKATGKDRKVKYKDRTVATIKTLVFHKGHAANGQRTDWVMYEYKMEDKHLANAGVIQDMYVLCKIFEKSGSGPKNGAQYGAPFNEEEWEDDVDSGSRTIVGPDGAAKTDYKQKDPAITVNVTLPWSARGLSITEPGSSTVTTFSPNETANTLNFNKQKDPIAVMSITELGSSSITFSANANVPANEDMILMEDFDFLGEPTKELDGNNKKEGVEADNSEKGKGVAANEDDGIYDGLDNLFNLEELNEYVSENFKTDRTEYSPGKIFATDDLGAELLSEFYVD